MNLYRILVEHYAPKDCLESIAGYLLAKDESEVYDVIKDANSEKFGMYLGWVGDEDELYWNEETEEEDLTHKEWVILNKGEMSDDQFITDLYYGVTLVGWELIEENVDMNSDFVQKLISLNIAVTK